MPGGEWKTISSDSNSITFENLSPGTEYTIQNRYKSDRDDTTGQEQFASFANSTTATTWPRITATSLKTGYVGVPYSAQLEAVVAEGHDGVVVSGELVSACRTDSEQRRNNQRYPHGCYSTDGNLHRDRHYRRGSEFHFQ